MTLREIYKRLNETYSGTMGVEYMHIADAEKCNWIREQLETTEHHKYTPQQQIQILKNLIRADRFEVILYYLILVYYESFIYFIYQ